MTAEARRPGRATPLAVIGVLCLAPVAGALAASAEAGRLAAGLVALGAALAVGAAGRWHVVVVASAGVAAAVSSVAGWAAFLPAAPLVAGVLARGAGDRPASRPAERALHHPGVLLALLVVVTLATAVTRPDASLTVVALVAGLALLAGVAWRYFAAVPTDAAAGAVLWSGVGTAVVFLAFAVPRIAGHGRGAWARIYEESPWVNPNTLGLFLVLALVVALVRLLHGERVVRHALAGLLLTTAVALNFSRSTYVAAVVVVLVVGVLLRARVGWLLVVAALLAWQVPDAVSERVFYTRSSGQLDVSSATRLELWQAALDLGLAHPWAGVGLHSLGPELSARVDGEYQFAHNSLMTLVAGTGLVLAVLVVVALVRSLRRLWRRARDREQAAVQAFLALVATLVCSAFGEPLLSLVVVVPLLALVAPALSGRPRPAAGPDLPSSPRPTRTPGSGHRNDPSR